MTTSPPWSPTTGGIHIATADTRQGGAISLPLHIWQAGGPTLAAPPPAPQVVAPPVAPAPDMPATGGGLATVAAGMLLVALGLTRRRRRLV